jgi:hypothetical protein
MHLSQKLLIFASEYEQNFPRNVHGMTMEDGEKVIIADMLREAGSKIAEMEAKPKVGRPPKDAVAPSAPSPSPA